MTRKDKKRARDERKLSMATKLKLRAEARSVVIGLFRSVDGIGISRRERDSLGQGDHKGLTYGEVDVMDFFPLLDLSCPQRGEVFVDLGSGTGKAVFTAALGFPFSKCIGIELLQGLHDTSVEVSKRVHQLIPSRATPPGGACLPIHAGGGIPDPACLPTPTGLCLPPIHLLHGDLMTEDWSEADVVFVASLLFDEVLLRGLTERATRLKPGSRILSLKKLHECPELVLVHEAYYRFSWDMAKVFMYRRSTVVATPETPPREAAIMP